MEIEIRLAKILQDYGLTGHGVVQKIADEIGVHRHTVRRIYHNQLRNPPLDVLGKICEWLQRHDVPADSLPAALFGAGERDLWRAVAAPGKIALYLGEYQRNRENTLVSWISRRDSAVETEFVRWLSDPAHCGQARPIFDTVYVPFRASLSSTRLYPKVFAEDCGHAGEIFSRMHQKRLKTGSVILIGSQRVNYLVECVVADLFNCAPFAARSSGRIPFYMTFPRRVNLVRSGFGSLKNPPTVRGAVRPGTYYVNANRQWQLCPWVDMQEDSGVVITCYDPGTKSCQLVVFGLTGRATESLGRYLTEHDKSFWPPSAESKHGHVGLYVCRFRYEDHAHLEDSEQGTRDTAVRDMEVIPLHPTVLQESLKR